MQNFCASGRWGRRVASGGALPPDFYFCPPDLFLALPLYFFVKVSITSQLK